ncbi:MAG: UbiX family flavin prenyltransferase [Chloroflexi bacterium]|nr:UbiX family flavin prenyltransferase [Chloroflexota bacterium]
MKLVVGISGATGAIFGVRLLQVLSTSKDVETHLVISPPAKRTIEHEMDMSVEAVEALADFVYDINDIGASISSGSFKTAGMVIAPCSIKTMSALANCYNTNLLIRAGDVTLKEGRPLVILARETPLHAGHLKLMLELAQMGATLLPPVPAFYHKPKSIDDIVNHIVGKVLDKFDIDHDLFQRWAGLKDRFIVPQK